MAPDRHGARSSLVVSSGALNSGSGMLLGINLDALSLLARGINLLCRHLLCMLAQAVKLLQGTLSITGGG